MTELLDGIVEVDLGVARLEIAATDVAGSEPSLSAGLVNIREDKPLAGIALAFGYTWHYLSIMDISSANSVQN